MSEITKPHDILGWIQVIVIIGAIFLWIAKVDDMKTQVASLSSEVNELNDLKVKIAELNGLHGQINNIAKQIDRSENQILLWLNRVDADNKAIISLLKEKYPEWSPPPVENNPIYWKR